MSTVHKKLQDILRNRKFSQLQKKHQAIENLSWEGPDTGLSRPQKSYYKYGQKETMSKEVKVYDDTSLQREYQ